MQLVGKVHSIAKCLWLKKCPTIWKIFLNDMVKAVNFIKANFLNSHLLADLCKDNRSDFETPLLYSHVKWLSKEAGFLKISLCSIKGNAQISSWC